MATIQICAPYNQSASLPGCIKPPSWPPMFLISVHALSFSRQQCRIFSTSPILKSPTRPLSHSLVTYFTGDIGDALLLPAIEGEERVCPDGTSKACPHSTWVLHHTSFWGAFHAKQAPFSLTEPQWFFCTASLT